MKKFEEIVDIDRLIIYLPYLKDGLEFARQKNYKEIVVSLRKFTIEKSAIDLIIKYPFIESLIFNEFYSEHKDKVCLNPLSQLENLKTIKIWGDNVFSIDFELFRNLCDIEYYDSKLIKNIDKAVSIKNLKVYNLKSTHLEEFSNMSHLQKLTLWDCKNTDIDGLLKLTRLKEIELIRSKKMKNINGLKNSIVLESLDIHNCNSLDDISVIQYLIRLRKLRLSQNKLITNLEQSVPNNIEILILNPSTIDNLNFVQQMGYLRQILLDNVLSNDLSPLLNCPSLENVTMTNKKSYNYKESEINSILKNKIQNI